MLLGVNLNSLTKVLKCARDDDECTIKAADKADFLNLVYKAKFINVNADKEEEEQVTDGKKIKKEKKVKKEAMDEQVEMDGDEFKANSNGEGEEEKEEDEDEGKEGRKKHKKS
ncbi:hypothetical protein H2248_006734 [Termitomyces sp. 'cryptogamus']|nr:hypothetical protein H2248_006734 [Termitomyces sp. 'cryptogamus']